MGTLIALPTSELYSYPLPPVSLQQQHKKTPGWETDTRRPDQDVFSRTPSLSCVPEEPLAEHSQQQQQHLGREELRQHMLAHSLKGHKMLVQRTPFVGAAETIVSPINPEVTFGIKRVGNREVMAHRDKNASIRYIQREGSDEYISEKDYPVGTLRVDTVALCLESWNIADAAGNPVKIDKESILSYLDPEELDFLNDEALRINPILAGQPAKKNNSNDA